jgi:ATP-binding cassette, subfamily B (MDR/TAP), member 6
MNDLDASSRGRAVDSLLNFETVKYFGNESKCLLMLEWEVNEYEKSILSYQTADWKSNASLNLLNTAQNVVITLGLVAGLSITAQRVVGGQLTVGDFVLFVSVSLIVDYILVAIVSTSQLVWNVLQSHSTKVPTT